MSFNHADYKIWWKLQRVEAKADFIESRLGSLISNPASGGGGDQQIYEGTADPNTGGVVPVDPTKPAMYNQKVGTVIITTWWWNITSQLWY